MTLLILAAGMGSRYGGLKQLDPMTQFGEFIIDFSVYDAIRSGFDKVVFVIKEENAEAFRETIGRRVEKQIKTEYVFQDISNIPSPFIAPEGRSKPWGTTHAVLSAESAVGNDTFAVINADDFYGHDAFDTLAKHLKKQNGTTGEYCMVGYILQNTLTDKGTVSRGECHTDQNGYLNSVCERHGVCQKGEMGYCQSETGGEIPLPLDTIVSMNCWGFTADIFPKLKHSFVSFLNELVSPDKNILKQECYLPNSVQQMIDMNSCRVKVYPTTSVWHGVTYHEDKADVKDAISKMIKDGLYPNGLWK